jgi:hypothetical protein
MNLRTLARVFGVVFLLVGILGFVPGITQMHTSLNHPDTGDLVVGGPGHGMLLGIFHVNLLHNLVHILFGIWGLVAAGSLSASRAYFRGVGVIYAVLALLGLIRAGNVWNTFGLVPIHGADVALHAILAIAGLYLGFAAKATDATEVRRDAPVV